MLIDVYCRGLWDVQGLVTAILFPNMEDSKPASIIAELHYADPAAALIWLSKAFGFETEMIVKDEAGELVFAEMKIDGASVAIVPELLGTMRSPKAAGGISTQTVQLRFTRNIDQHYQQAKANGAVILSEPETHFFGDRTYIAADLEGHTWNFGQRLTEAGAPPKGWSIEFPA